ncbi:ketoacyl-ACP synthase III [Lysinibacillus fusiformis]|uniref:3-oxoacyl-ACP synthase III family protein n=1 Tax=Lysinibacillus fusiformis TaxID=28031 RepID=UPI002E23E3A7|nr:ketoacyl-ACP synthase III [Lysinibacillus fusiformis]
MAIATFNNVQVSGIASAVPQNVRYIMDFKGELEEAEIKKFTKTTGVEKYHYTSEKQTTSDLCYVAAEKLIAHKQIEKDSIDAIIFLSQSPDYIMPATSHVLHKRLGLTQNCIAFDVNLGCSGYVYGLYLAATLLQKGSIKRVLFLAGDTGGYNPELKAKDKMLFGDAGTATLIEAGQDEIQCLLKSDGAGYGAIISPKGSHRNPIKEPLNYFEDIKGEMHGDQVFEFTISEIPKAFEEFFEIYGGEINDYDYCVFHQANRFMLKHIAKKIKLPTEKMPISIDRYGNTSSASIPLGIADICETQEVPERLKLITSGFGIGLSWGVMNFEVNKSDVLPIIYTDAYYKEAYSGQ